MSSRPNACSGHFAPCYVMYYLNRNPPSYYYKILQSANKNNDTAHIRHLYRKLRASKSKDTAHIRHLYRKLIIEREDVHDLFLFYVILRYIYYFFNSRVSVNEEILLSSKKVYYAVCKRRFY